LGLWGGMSKGMNERIEKAISLLTKLLRNRLQKVIFSLAKKKFTSTFAFRLHQWGISSVG
jgi:hypothetical protein